MKNIRLLIVEDEIAIANLIKNLIDFDRLNLDFIGIALNGQQALNLARQEHPDIVITDISMPGMNGLQLIDEIQKQEFLTHFIIISGMTQFQYALSALKMGVEDYLLKPINRDELNDVLEKTILKIADSLKIDYQIQKLNFDSHLQRQKLRHSFIMDILYNSQKESALTLAAVNEDYGFSFQKQSLFLMGIVQIDGISSLNLPTQNAIIEQLMRIFQTGIKDRCIENEVYGKNNQFIFLINFTKDFETNVLGAISNLHKDMSDYLDHYENLSLAVSCGISVDSINCICNSFSSAYKVLSARILMGTSHVIFAEKLMGLEEKSAFVLLESTISSLRSAIEIKDLRKTKDILIQIFKNAAYHAKTHPHLLLDIYRDAVSELLSNLHLHKIINGNLTDYFIQYCDLLEQQYTFRELIEYTISFIMKILPLQDSAVSLENHTIQTAKEYIQKHFHENLKLEDVAEQIYLSPSYFGVLFKKEVGESFSSYLTMVRIEAAKKYLQDTKYSVADVAYAVGYQDKRYFSKLFKEQVGITPKEFRKIYLYQ